MQSWTFYPVFIGTAVSIVSLTHFAVTQRVKLNTRTLSELATLEQKSISHFRNILLFCGTLFAITMFGFIVPNTPHQLLTLIFSLAVIIGELFAGVIPAHKNTIKIHEGLAGIMGVGMLALAYLFWFSFHGGYMAGAAALAILMSVLAFLMIADKSRRHFVVYELAFIFSSHISIVLAALALR